MHKKNILSIYPLFKQIIIYQSLIKNHLFKDFWGRFYMNNSRKGFICWMSFWLHKRKNNFSVRGSKSNPLKVKGMSKDSLITLTLLRSMLKIKVKSDARFGMCTQKTCLYIHTTFKLKTTNENIKVSYKIHPSLKGAIIERNKKKTKCNYALGFYFVPSKMMKMAGSFN